MREVKEHKAGGGKMYFFVIRHPIKSFIALTEEDKINLALLSLVLSYIFMKGGSLSERKIGGNLYDGKKTA